MRISMAVGLIFAAPALVNAQSAGSPVDTLAHVMESKTLRVCTPGDYRPFSYHNDDDSYEGLDIDLMRDLADTLGAQAVFVKTTWKNLMDDFTSGKCDAGA